MNHFHTWKNKFGLLVCLIVLFPVDLLSQEADFPYNSLFLPLIFDGKLPVDISLTLPDDPCRKEKILSPALEIPLSFTDAKKVYIDSLRKEAYRHVIRNDILSVKYTLSDFPDEVEKVEKIEPNIFRNLFRVEADYGINAVDNSARFVPKRKYWIVNGSSLVQFSQNYITRNWYNGGIGNLNLLSVQNFTFNYKKGKQQFNNFVEWKLSFYTNPNDSLRDFRLGEDMVRTYSDFGYMAFNDKWAYSTNLEIKTKLLRNYRENSMEYVSSFMSPLQINMGILGMKYHYEKISRRDKHKKYNLSVDFSPLSVQYTWVADKNVNPTRYGIPEGKHYLLDKGSTLNARMVVNFNKQVTFSSRLKYFTNYDKVIVESENELNMPLNRFFSTRIYLYGRFDDTKGIQPDPTLGYLQLNELLSFGFNYKW